MKLRSATNYKLQKRDGFISLEDSSPEMSGQSPMPLLEKVPYAASRRGFSGALHILDRQRLILRKRWPSHSLVLSESIRAVEEMSDENHPQPDVLIAEAKVPRASVRWESSRQSRVHG